MSEPDFTPRQLEAVDVSLRLVDACVVAGPGSGKTTVLVAYFRRLVEAGVDPARILAITFTEKAAAQMRNRLVKAFQEQREVRPKLERAWVSTVHGFCARLLRENSVAAGVDPGFTIAEERETGRWQQEAMAEAMEAVFAERPAGVRALIRGLASAGFEEAMLSAYDAMRGAGAGIDKLAGFAVPPGREVGQIAAALGELREQDLSGWNAAQKGAFEAALDGFARIVEAQSARGALDAMAAFACDLRKLKRGSAAVELVKTLRDVHLAEYQRTLITRLYAAERELLIEVLRRFDANYRRRKSGESALDFADLEEFAVRLLEDSPETRGRLQAHFEHVLMDELQDTNGQQARLLRLVRPPGRFYGVGDVNQSIFGFRHAAPQEFCNYREEARASGGRVVELVENFRSRGEILRAVETVTAGAGGIEARRLIAGKAFETGDGDAPRVEAIVAQTLDAEARAVARRMLELHESGPRHPFGGMAVLVRNTDVFPEFMAAFEDAGIPYVVNRAKGFWETREVNDLVQVLRTIANPLDEISLAAVLRSPLVGIADETLLRLRLAGGTLAEALARLGAGDDEEMGAEDLEALLRFRGRLLEWRRRREYVGFDRLLLDAMDETGYAAAAGSRAAANIERFLAQARAAAPRSSLDAFLRDLELLRESHRAGQDPAPEEVSAAVQMMSVHSAKGLEFPVVFVAAMHKGVQGNLPVVAFSPCHGLGASWRNPARREEIGDLFHEAIRGERAGSEAQESDRLLYVAMTRAEQHLVLSFSAGGRKPANWARLLVDRLGFEPERPGERTLPQATPHGESWTLRVSVEAGLGPAIAAGPPAARLAPQPVELLPPPAVTGQFESNVTVTALGQFARCPRRYYLGSYLGFQGKPHKTGDTAAGDGLTAAELGIQVHALLAEKPVEDPDPRAQRLAAAFRKGPLGRRVERATRVEREFDFLMAVDPVVVSGQIDLWFEEGGELAIVDYKTDAVAAQDVPHRAREYELQVRLYAMAVERVTGRAPTRACLHFLAPDVVVDVDLAPSLIDSPEETVRDFVEAQERMEFPLREGEQCKRCPFYRELCPAG